MKPDHLDAWARAMGDETKARIEAYTAAAGEPDSVCFASLVWPMDARSTGGAATFSTNLDTSDPRTLELIAEVLEEAAEGLREKAARRPFKKKKGKKVH